MGGGPSTATKQQQQVTLAASEQQLDFDKQLMALFEKQFSSQQDVLNQIKATVTPVIKQSLAGEGFSPEALAAMRTSATEGLTTQFENAQAALNQTLKTSGDANVPSGVTVGANEALLNVEAQAQAGAQRDITVQNQEQATSNLWNSLNALNGVAAQENPLGYASSATGGSGAVAGLGESQAGLQNAITNADNASFFGKLMTGISTGIGNIPYAIH
jgi:hypothetical protein